MQSNHSICQHRLLHRNSLSALLLLLHVLSLLLLPPLFPSRLLLPPMHPTHQLCCCVPPSLFPLTQVPRLTTVLRSLAATASPHPTGPPLLDPEAAALQRQQQLAAKQAAAAAADRRSQAAGASELSQRLLGPPSKGEKR
jgi:hypothetical protein